MFIETTHEALPQYPQPSFEVPYELQQGRSAESARRLTRRLLCDFGRLLEAWPSVFSAAKAMQARVEVLAKPL